MSPALPVPPLLLALAGILVVEAMTLAAVSDWITAAPIAFVVGLAVGFVLSNRYRITKRDNNGTVP